MPRAVLDSSVLISALLTPHGTSDQVLDAAKSGAFALFLSREIITETAGVLLDKPKLATRYGYDAEHVEEFCDGLAAFAQLVTDLPTERFVPDDPKDDVIIATAVAARADYLVTGDRQHLLALGSCQGIQIVTPRQLLDFLGHEEQERAA